MSNEFLAWKIDVGMHTARHGMNFQLNPINTVPIPILISYWQEKKNNSIASKLRL